MHNVEFKTSISLTLRFNRVYNRHYLCGITYDGHTIGYKGDGTATIVLERWTGLRLLSDGHGFVSVQARDHPNWRNVDTLLPLHSLESELRHCEVVWDKGSTQGTIVLSLDVRHISLFVPLSHILT